MIISLLFGYKLDEKLYIQIMDEKACTWMKMKNVDEQPITSK